MKSRWSKDLRSAFEEQNSKSRVNKIDKSELQAAIEKLENHIISEEYRGYDPYDGLMSPIFKLPILKSNKIIRFAFQQVFRRIPFNLRPILGIRKGLNPVTLGLFIQACTYLSKVFVDYSDFYLSQIDYCVHELAKLRSLSYSGACWGYDFDWEARYAKIPAFMPTVVATGIIENGLYEYYCHFKDDRAKELILSAAEFVVSDLNRSYDGGTFCFSYSPNDSQKVYNATMKGARILSHAYAISSDAKYIEEARKTVKFVIDHQNENGSWYYSSGDARKWIDNIHTGYVLDCLRAYCDISYDADARACFDRGLEFYVKTFFNDDGTPKYYDNDTYPIDSTAIAQSILTLAQFGFSDLGLKASAWAVANMQSDKGHFYYQKNRMFVNKVPYMRWSNAWMFAALAFMLLKLQQS